MLKNINGEREVPGRRKVVRGSNVSVLTSHVGQNPRSKSGYEPERRVIKNVNVKPSTGCDRVEFCVNFAHVILSAFLLGYVIGKDKAKKKEEK